MYEYGEANDRYTYREGWCDMKLDRTYIVISDPGHAWAQVPMAVLEELGIKDKITPYSYISWSGKTAYLEEDVDATTLIKALEARGLEFKQRIRYADNGSSIRRLPWYPSC